METGRKKETPKQSYCPVSETKIRLNISVGLVLTIYQIVKRNKEVISSHNKSKFISIEEIFCGEYSKKLDDNTQHIKYLFNQTSDLVVRNLKFGSENSERAALLYILMVLLIHK